jgi:hypothetical protein
MRQSGALQYLADSALGRPDFSRICIDQLHSQLSRSPLPPLARPDDQLDRFIAYLTREMLRYPATVSQSGFPLSGVARQPLVDRLARYAVNPPQGRNALALFVILNQLNSKVHRSALFPRHCL